MTPAAVATEPRASTRTWHGVGFSAQPGHDGLRRQDAEPGASDDNAVRSGRRLVQAQQSGHGDEVVGEIHVASWRVLERENKQFLAEHGLEPFEFDVLTTLRRSGEPAELTPSALFKATLVTSGAMTNRIDRMEVKGLVERVRDLDDRRSIRIRLTPHGREVLDGIFRLHVANMERILQPLDQQMYEHLAAALRILLESFGDTSLE